MLFPFPIYAGARKYSYPWLPNFCIGFVRDGQSFLGICSKASSLRDEQRMDVHCSTDKCGQSWKTLATSTWNLNIILLPTKVLAGCTFASKYGFKKTFSWCAILKHPLTHLKNGGFVYTLSADVGLCVSTARCHCDNALRVCYHTMPRLDVGTEQLQWLALRMGWCSLAADFRHVRVQSVSLRSSTRYLTPVLTDNTQVNITTDNITILER